MCQMSAYTLQAPALPFPVFVLSYTINGMGMALEVGVHGFARLRRVPHCRKFSRMPKPPVTLPHSQTMPSQKWGFCTPLTVCRFK